MANVVMERSISVLADDWVVSVLTRCMALSTTMGWLDLLVALVLSRDVVFLTRESRLSLSEVLKVLSRACFVAASAVEFSSSHPDQSDRW